MCVLQKHTAYSGELVILYGRLTLKQPKKYPHYVACITYNEAYNLSDFRCANHEKWASAFEDGSAAELTQIVRTPIMRWWLVWSTHLFL